MNAQREKVETFGELQRGDVVKLTREQGDFTFLAAVVEGNDVLWLDLHGGRPHHEKMRSVAVDRVKIPSDRQLARQRRGRADMVAK